MSWSATTSLKSSIFNSYKNTIEAAAMFTDLIILFLHLFPLTSSRSPPYSLRLNCGAREDVHSQPTKTLWFKDFGYTGGIPTNGSRPSFLTPKLKTVRYFPLSQGPENCYNIDRLRNGHYSMRIFFGLIDDPNLPNEPLFDISIEGTLIDSLRSGWINRDDESFLEALVFITDGTASICFHSTGHGDPVVLSIEIQQVDDRSYYFGANYDQGTIFRTVKRISCGFKRAKFGVDYGGDPWGGDRYWENATYLDSKYENTISTGHPISRVSVSPNFYPQGLYQTALISTDAHPDIEYTLYVDPNRNYSIWLHFSEIDSNVTDKEQRVFEILINGEIAFNDVDVVKLSGGTYTALVLNKTVAVIGRALTITIRPTKGSYAIISAIEVLEVIIAESKTLTSEVRALQKLKSSLGLPLRIGWNGDPCVPQQHPWTSVDCQFDTNISKWTIDGLDLNNQGLRGVLPNEISQLRHLLSLNLSGNDIHGHISSFLGNLTHLETLDLSYNSLNGSIPESFKQLTSLQRLNLNVNSLSGKVPAALGERLLHRASYNFTDNSGLCGIPGLPKCGFHLSIEEKIGIGIGVSFGILLTLTFSFCYWKRRQNIHRAQRIAAREAPYAKARIQFSRDLQLSRHGYDLSRSTSESGRILIS